MSEVIINSDQSLEDYIANLRSEYKAHRYLRMSLKTGMQRTLTQNAALHKYCKLLADDLNEAGLDMKQVIKPGIDIPWTMESVKENLWKPVQIAVTGKESTTKPLTNEYNEIYEVLSRHLSMKLGIDVAWPTRESI